MQVPVGSILDEIEKLEAEATEGPWSATDEYKRHEIHMGSRLDSPSRYESHHVIEYDHSLYPEDGEQWGEADTNARLIVALRNNVKTLLRYARKGYEAEVAKVGAT